MKIPKTTSELPYIEFRMHKNGTLKLSLTSDWWGGKNSGFTSSNGSEGNSCPPEKLEKYIKAFKERKIYEIEKEIKNQIKLLKTLKANFELWDF